MNAAPAGQLRANGFTLIELIAVIVIIGVIAITALAQFSDLGRDARQTQIAQLRAALESAASDSTVLCMANQNCAFSTSVVIFPVRGRDCVFVNGFIDAGDFNNGLYCEIHDFVNTSGFTVYFDPLTNYTEFRLTAAPTPTACYARYSQVFDVDPFGTRPRITTVTTGC